MNKKLADNIAGLCLLILSPSLWAANEPVPWIAYLLSVMAISSIIAGLLSYRNEKAETMMAKLLLGGLYFWVLTFAQLMVLAFIYYLNK